jgi:hypothetical protein
MRKRFSIVPAIPIFTIIGGMALQVLRPAGSVLQAIAPEAGVK